MPTLSQVLVDDPELAAHLESPRLAAAVRDCVAQTLDLPSGAWSPGDTWSWQEMPANMNTGLGLLILQGLIVRAVGVAGRYGAELLGTGDLLAPWQLDDRGKTLPRTGRWRALSPCRMAVLDSDFVARLARYPEVTSCLFARAMRRAAHLAVQMAIMHQPRIDVRLHMLFWELADRWGTVRSDGVHLPLSLTHAMLADLVAARRPTVTKALGELSERGAIQWTGSGWRLIGDPPSELDLGPVAISTTAD